MFSELPFSHSRAFFLGLTTVGVLRNRLTEHYWENHVTVEGGDSSCSKTFAARGGVAAAGVEGFFTPDGVVVGNIFLDTAESPEAVVDGIRNMKVRKSHDTTRVHDFTSSRRLRSDMLFPRARVLFAG